MMKTHIIAHLTSGPSCQKLKNSRVALTSAQGRTVEWHVDLPNSFEHLSFELVSRLHHSIVLLLPAFSLPWFKSIGSIGDAMSSDSVKQLIVETSTAHRTAVALHGDQC
jgi:hypothetical protein